MKKQVFPVFDPISEQLLDYKPRDVVHTQGDWHRGVQANILRRNNTGSFDILVQERSANVDIGTRKYDQSLATQMLDIDNQDQECTLQRGLLNELGISSYRAVKLKRNLRIVKTYEEHPGTLNRELISLFLVEIVDNQSAVVTTQKIENIFWMEWKSFLEFFYKHASKFTKTAQFYFSNSELLSQIEEESHAMLYSTDTAKSHHTYLSPPIVHVNKWPEKSYTHTGNIVRGLTLAGEL